MKRALLVLAAAMCCYLALSVGSASALNYVCYWGSDVSRTVPFSNATWSQTSTVTFQYGFDCTGQIVVIKTKTINTSVTFKVGYPSTMHTLAGGYLAKNGGSAYYQLTDKQASCYGGPCTVSLSWQPYVSTNYDASNYSWHGALLGTGLSGTCGFDHYYDPASTNYLEYNCQV